MRSIVGEWYMPNTQQSIGIGHFFLNASNFRHNDAKINNSIHRLRLNIEDRNKIRGGLYNFAGNVDIEFKWAPFFCIQLVLMRWIFERRVLTLYLTFTDDICLFNLSINMIRNMQIKCFKYAKKNFRLCKLKTIK